ncbi:hypothetical protein CcrC1_gp137c [Caulobacter phage C1]|nr:hypothetical protein CcrC1_gp137c [Caulobacter phage C1]UTU08366.1 hypothetical protein CcrC2_gp138c [Caulobacter phage C2]UTU08883.1 hypothetical protein CcrJ4_gp132c [Caulobacter phage J4]UTU09439.1 hypothetical protein CcrBL47_gp153c [Caulobacter phage BL47]UTU09999.1 hypothetical protein CcrRB23_gp137c [Caulobacter phage RB23]WGN97024.1 hypothetical protein [Bertelyvirus sp.]
MSRTIVINTVYEAAAEILNANGEVGIIDIYTKQVDPDQPFQGSFYASLMPATEVGDELQLQFYPRTNTAFGSSQVVVFARPHYGVANPRIVFSDVSAALTLQVPQASQPDVDMDGKADTEGDGTGYQRLVEAVHVPEVAMLRWTGSYWFCYARTAGVLTGDFPPHA